MPIPGRSRTQCKSLALGCMELAGSWNPPEVGPEQVKKRLRPLRRPRIGINFFDHATFTGHRCERLFKDCMAAIRPARESLVIATKCGIKSGYYDLTYDAITKCAEDSLKRLVSNILISIRCTARTSCPPRETAEALKDLVRRGLVLHVGVSNYYPSSFSPCSRIWRTSDLDKPVQISLMHLEFSTRAHCPGVLDQCEALAITPLAWAPLAGDFYAADRRFPPTILCEILKRPCWQSLLAGRHAQLTPATWPGVAIGPSFGIIPLVAATIPRRQRVNRSFGCIHDASGVVQAVHAAWVGVP